MHVTYGRGSVLLWRRCGVLCIFGLWMTSCWQNGQKQSTRKRRGAILRVTQRGAGRFDTATNAQTDPTRRQHRGPGTKSDIYDCLVVHADDAQHSQERPLPTQVRDVSLPVENDYFLSRLRTADSAPQDWQISCTDTAEVVHQLIKTWRRVYAEYQADALLLPVDPLSVGRYSNGRISTTLCLERRFRWTGTVHVPTHAQSIDAEKLPEVGRTCPPEMERLVHTINGTHATYLAVTGGAEAVFGSVRCIPFERLPVHVVSIERHDDDVISARTPRRTLGLSRADVDQEECENELIRRGWSFHSETTQDLVFVRRHDIVRLRRWSRRHARG